MTPSKDPLPTSPQVPNLGALDGVSVILPVLNEELHISEAIDAILAQDYLGKLEIILALGPSRDQTVEIVRSLQDKDVRIILVDNPTGRTATGLNLALSKSHYSIIVRVDGHAQIPHDYISTAVRILNETGAVNVGGVMGAEGVTSFEKSVASAMRSPLGVGSSNFHTGGDAGPVDTVYLGCFNRLALEKVGGFDERFKRAQDWELNFRLRSAGGVVYFDPRLHVTYRPRPNLIALAKQYFEYGRWRRVVMRRHQGTANLRYLAPPCALIGTVTSLICGIAFSPLFFFPAMVYLLFILSSSLAIGKGVTAKFRLPAILLVMHMSWGAGFLTSPKTLAP